MRCIEITNTEFIKKGRQWLIQPSTYRLGILVLMACVYILLFIPPNLAGAKDPNLLATHNLDEYVQFPHVIRMTSLGGSLSETLTNVLVYRHYFYGYSFYLISAFVILPFRLAFSVSASRYSTIVYMLVLREQSPLFMAVAILLLVYLWTEFKSLTRSALPFLFLGTIPAIFNNNMWWHPDSLVTLFVVLTIFALSRDALRFGKWFYLAAVFCGLATGTKVIGLFFFLSVAVYLILGWINRTIGFRDLAKHGSLFILVMSATIVASNPVLLVPSMAGEIFRTLEWQATMNAFGWGFKMSKGPLAWYHEVLEHFFGYWWLYALVVLACFLTIVFDQKRRLLSIIILTWSIPYSLYLLFFVAHKAPHYFIPILLPLFSCIASPILLWDFKNYNRQWRKPMVALPILAILLLGFQFIGYVRSDADHYNYVSLRLTVAPALGFYEKFEAAYFSTHEREKPLTVLRDINVYVPSLPQFDIKEKYGCWNYEEIAAINPDVILLEKLFINHCSDPNIVEISANREQARKSFSLYSDAKHSAIKGYRKIVETELYVAFEKE